MSAGLPIAVVSVSGGKDSTATAILALDRYGKDCCRFVFADTGHEHPLTTKYLFGDFQDALGITVETVRAEFTAEIAGKRKYVAEKWAGKGVSQEVIDRTLTNLQPTGNPFLDLCLWKGRFPSTMARFCTQELKRYPLERFMMNLLTAGHKPESWQGIRRDESRNRADALEEEMSAEGWMIRRPIVHWTGQQVVDFVKSRNVPLNPLYSLGMGRVGCMPCVNVNKAELSEIASRFPEEIDRIEQWEAKVGQCSKRAFGTLLHHSDGKGGDSEHAYNHSNIRAMVDWAKTSRGGHRLRPIQGCASCNVL